MPLSPASLPPPEALRRRAQALAMLDAILSPEWEYRYYSFNAAWGDHEAMASMRNGSGDDWFLLFGPFGTGLKGLDHETPFAEDRRLAEEVQRVIPPAFDSFLKEPAFSMDRLSYCYWRGATDDAWHQVVHPDPAWVGAEDGATDFLALLWAPAAAYRDFAAWYYELDVPLALIERIYHHDALDAALVASLNPEAVLADVESEAAEIGYPCHGRPSDMR